MENWWAGRDSNSHAFRHTPLKRTCLPIPPPAHVPLGEGGILLAFGPRCRKCFLGKDHLSARSSKSRPSLVKRPDKEGRLSQPSRSDQPSIDAFSRFNSSCQAVPFAISSSAFTSSWAFCA